MFEITALPAFRDNYIWLLHAEGLATVVDPGDAAPVEAALARLNLKLHSILVTHHHDDHIGGVAELSQHWNPVIYAPARERYNFLHRPVGEDDCIVLPHLPTTFRVLDVPGHTSGHVAYYGANCLFCGDTMFSGGCGRLFEGSPAQLLASLKKLAALPPQTEVYCTHEYTEHNLQFAVMLEPHNLILRKRQEEVLTERKAGKPSLPSSIEKEQEINPFLRCTDAALQKALEMPGQDELAVFTEMRRRRNHF